ncbi:MAG: TolB family protein [Kangiellaceae bacterium]
MRKQIGVSFILVGLVLNSLVFSSFGFSEEDEQPVSPPDSEVHLFDLAYQQKSGQNESYKLSNGINISNNLGYDNQPYFASNSKSLFYVSVQDGEQTDVYEYHIKNKKTKQITNTPHSEYSPKTSDNNLISFVSEGGNPYQSVWQLNKKNGQSKWLFNSKEPVGYYQVNENTGDVLFWSRYGWSVQYLNLKRDESRFVSGNALPSSPMQIPNTNLFSFVHRQTNSEVWIKSFDPTDFSITPIAPIYGNNYDYTWAPNGEIFRVEENVLYVWGKKRVDDGWRKVQDLTKNFKGKISRLAISPDGKKIALVENR